MLKVSAINGVTKREHIQNDDDKAMLFSLNKKSNLALLTGKISSDNYDVGASDPNLLIMCLKKH